MELNINNAPTSPLTTSSSYVNPNTGKVINHNMQITFSQFPEMRPFGHSSVKDTHNVFVQQLAPTDLESQINNALNMLFENDTVKQAQPKYALVWQQIVGKNNDSFERVPTVLALSYH
jgi:hypothetical protein